MQNRIGMNFFQLPNYRRTIQDPDLKLFPILVEESD